MEGMQNYDLDRKVLIFALAVVGILLTGMLHEAWEERKKKRVRCS